MINNETANMLPLSLRIGIHSDASVHFGHENRPNFQ
jgi:hypothetical protein